MAFNGDGNVSPPLVPPTPQPTTDTTQPPSGAPSTGAAVPVPANTSPTVAAPVAAGPQRAAGPASSTPAVAATPSYSAYQSHDRAAIVPGRGVIPDADMARAERHIRDINHFFSQRVVGQDRLRTALVSTLLAGGHILLESVPGLAKTTAAETLAAAVGGTFHRIQCTPDLMPNDIVGTQIYNYGTGSFTTQLGPVHANVVLLDEINRSSAKTQSAMLEAMQERQTSIGGEVYRLPHPFMVLATQNPIEEEGTYVLPEAQMDRFLMKEVLTYPTPAHEIEILERISSGRQQHELPPAPVTLADIEFVQELVSGVYVDVAIKRYIVDIINTTRFSGPRPIPGLSDQLRVGASPRGAIALMKVGQALALQAGRTFVIPDDIKASRHAVLRHRLVRTFDALANGIQPEQIIDVVFDAVPAP